MKIIIDRKGIARTT